MLSPYDRKTHKNAKSLVRCIWHVTGWLVGVEFNAPLDTVQVISEAVFTANHLTDTDKQNSTGKQINKLDTNQKK